MSGIFLYINPAMCVYVRCEGDRAREEAEECSRACHPGDRELIYVGKFMYRLVS